MTRIATLCRVAIALVVVCWSLLAGASPLIDSGDQVTRHDIQRLADAGIIKGPVTTWPLAWGPVLADLRNVDVSELPPGLADSVTRLLHRGQRENRTDVLSFKSEFGTASKPTRIRSFQDTPRGDVELSAGAEWAGTRFSAEINLQYVDGDPEVDEFRGDGSMIGVTLGNWLISANTLERWWGPGWDGSLILSNNARPIPSITLDRTFTDPFETRWLSWLGPWDLSLTFGQLESDRVVRNARFFGMRVNFRPLPSLELGVFRTAQWCGDGRPCGVDTFVDLFLGRDNRGDEGIDTTNEPGNQLAGVDFRWAPPWLDRQAAIYGQVVGEDEAGGFPSRWLGQVGAERTGYLFDRWSTRVFGEFSATSCQFYESSEIFDCAYNHSIYRTGYRYRGRAIGHGADGDARMLSAGIVAVDSHKTQWNALLRYGKLNRGGAPDPWHSLTPGPRRIASIDLLHARRLSFGYIDAGIGYETVDDLPNGSDSSDVRLFIRWRSAD